jgi:hypothetical protein
MERADEATEPTRRVPSGQQADREYFSQELIYKTGTPEGTVREHKELQNWRAPSDVDHGHFRQSATLSPYTNFIPSTTNSLYKPPARPSFFRK